MATKTILVADEISNEGIDILKGALEVSYLPKITAQELLDTIENYDALLVRSRTQVTKEVIRAGRKLKVIGRAGVGVDNIDVSEATQAGIVVLNSPEGNTASASEHTTALMMSLARSIPSADNSVKAGKWERNKFIGSELFNKTLGVVGLGKIGTRVAQTALAQGMKVIVYDPLVAAERVSAMNMQSVSLEVIWERADFITIHTPKTPETSNLLNESVFAKLKRGVRIINTSRGGIINEADLAKAIKDGIVAGAALDVYEEEPPKNNLLAELGDKVILTPHLGASTVEAQYNVAIDLAEQIRDFLATGIAKSPVNLPFMRPEILKSLGKYVWLAESMGAIVGALCDGNIQKVEIITSGTLAEKDSTPLCVAALRGLFSSRVEGVTYVNAQLVAKQHGINLQQSRSSSEDNDELSVRVVSDTMSSSISGVVLPHNEAIVTKINDYPINLTPARYMLFTSHKDQPGMVARVASILGDNNINISTMSVGRQGPRESAVMVMTLDDPLPSKINAQLGNADGIHLSRFVSLNHSGL